MTVTALVDNDLLTRLREAYRDKLYLTRAELAPVLRMTPKTLGRCEEAGEIASRRKGAGKVKPRRVYALEDVLKAKFLKPNVQECQSISPRARRATSMNSGGVVVAFSARPARKRSVEPA